MDKEYITQMRDPGNVVEFDELKTWFYTDAGIVRSVDGISFDVPAGKVVGVVGESGCGKSVTSLSLMGLLQKPQGRITGGQIRLNMGEHAYDLTKLPEKQYRQLRGNVISMIFQEPMSALNPVMRIGEQIAEVLLLHDKSCPTKARAMKKAEQLLQTVGIPDPGGTLRRYPHALSGGMRQRVCIAIALACSPRLLVADEPTTALDVTVQAQILSLLRDLKDKLGSAVLFITHDLGVVAQLCDLVVVMYAGRVVETGTVREIFHHCAHPYTRGLMASKPVVGKRTDRLYAIGGAVPSPIHLPEGCYFRNRCDHADENCATEYPCRVSLSPTHTVSCYRGVKND